MSIRMRSMRILTYLLVIHRAQVCSQQQRCFTRPPRTWVWRPGWSLRRPPRSYMLRFRSGDFRIHSAEHYESRKRFGFQGKLRCTLAALSRVRFPRFTLVRVMWQRSHTTSSHTTCLAHSYTRATTAWSIVCAHLFGCSFCLFSLGFIMVL